KSWLLVCSIMFSGAFFAPLTLASFVQEPPKADLVVVKKSQYRLSILRNGKEIKSFWIALGANPVGHKVMRGDNRTPEGRYLLDYKKDDSQYYKAIHISYPNSNDIERAQAIGVNPGNMLMIHGQPNAVQSSSVQRSNWTNGCIALLNHDMDEIWRLIEPGTPIEIYP
ncbi:MAG: L,D-transpeptidase family protein, partial [Plesiomonas sp.]